MKTWLKILAMILCLVMLCGCTATADPTDPSNDKTEPSVNNDNPSDPTDPTDPAVGGVIYDKGDIDEATTPVLKVRINETYWKYIDLTPYLGQDNVWIKGDIDLKYLVEGINQVAIDTNAYNYGNKIDKSVDLYYTLCGDGGFDTFISTDVMNSWGLQADRYANIVLELQRADNDEWETISFNDTFAQDESVVIGMFVPQETMYNACRNLTVESLANYKAARVAVNMKVGTSLLEVPQPEEPDEVDPGNPLDTTVPVLKVKINGAIAERVELAPYYGQNSVWVTVPLRFEKLRIGNNYVALDSNVYNPDNLTDQTVDLYFTMTTAAGGGELSQDGCVTWVQYGDRIPNMYLELHNTATGEWERVGDFEFSDQQEHTVIGMFSNPWLTSPFAFRRMFSIETLDGYDDVRVSMQIHVGGDLSLEAPPAEETPSEG